MKNKYGLTLLASGLLMMANIALADVDTSTGLGRTRLDACTDAKQSAVQTNTPYNFEITSFGQCDCEQSSDDMWKCVVEYRSHHKDANKN